MPTLYLALDINAMDFLPQISLIVCPNPFFDTWWCQLMILLFAVSGAGMARRHSCRVEFTKSAGAAKASCPLCCAVLLLQFWVGTLPYKTASLLTCLAESIALSLDCAAAHVLLQQISLDGAVPFKRKKPLLSRAVRARQCCVLLHISHHRHPLLIQASSTFS